MTEDEFLNLVAAGITVPYERRTRNIFVSGIIRLDIEFHARDDKLTMWIVVADTGLSNSNPIIDNLRGGSLRTEVIAQLGSEVFSKIAHDPWTYILTNPGLKNQLQAYVYLRLEIISSKDDFLRFARDILGAKVSYEKKKVMIEMDFMPAAIRCGAIIEMGRLIAALELMA